MTEGVVSGVSGRPDRSLRAVLVPLALAQFICSFAGSNMNVMINDISVASRSASWCTASVRC